MARREARRAALQLLYALDAGGTWEQFDEQGRLYFAHLAGELDAGARELAETLCRRVVEDRERLDRQIEAASSHWRLERMSRVDRSILRLAAAELVGSTGTPVAVVLDEAIELAKEFGSPQSPSFVNGVLDALVRALGGARS